MNASRCAVFSATVVVLATSAHAASSLTALGDIPGGTFQSQAFALSGDGTTAVGKSDSGSSSGQESFRWTSGPGMAGLGYLPGSVISFGWANGVSSDGNVVVGLSDVSSGINAFRWTPGGGMQNIGDLPGGGNVSVADAVSADGNIVVGHSDSTSGQEAFKYNATTSTMTGLGDLAGGGFQSVALGSSSTGAVIAGWGTPASGLPQACYWTPGSPATAIPLMTGGNQSYGNAISADGSTIVGHGESSIGTQAFRWTSATGTVPLGLLPSGFTPSIANAVNADGSVIVGRARSGTGPLVAFYWTQTGGMQSLWDILMANGIDPSLDGWTNLEEAKGVSLDGLTVAGFGTRNGNQEAFIAVVPEPGSLSLLVLAAAALLRRRAHRSAAELGAGNV